jgi:hypothetical protein
LALDEPNEVETIYDQDGLVILGDSRLQDQLERNGALTIDYSTDAWRGRGFVISFADASGCC